MTNDQHIFLRLAVVEQKKYDDFVQIMGVERSQLTLWWKELKGERETLSKIRQIWSKKCSETDFWKFTNWYTSANKICHYCNIVDRQTKVE